MKTLLTILLFIPNLLFAKQEVATVTFYATDNSLRIAFLYSTNCDKSLQSLIETTKPTANMIISSDCMSSGTFEQLYLNIYNHVFVPSQGQGAILPSSTMMQCLSVENFIRSMGFNDVVSSCY